MAWTFCTKEDVIDITPIPITSLKDSWSDMVEGLIKTYTREAGLGSFEVITNDYYNGDGTGMLQVRKTPIYSVESLYVGGPTPETSSLLTASDYVVFPNYIQLKSQVFPVGIMNVILNYTMGTTDIPGNVRLASAAMIVAIINYNKRAGADASIKWGSGDVGAGENGPNYNVGLTSHLMQIMKRTLKRKIRVG